MVLNQWMQSMMKKKQVCACVTGCECACVYMCNGVEEPRRRTVTQAAESVKMETTAGVLQQSGFICSAADNFQHTQNPHAHA